MPQRRGPKSWRIIASAGPATIAVFREPRRGLPALPARSTCSQKRDKTRRRSSLLRRRGGRSRLLRLREGEPGGLTIAREKIEDRKEGSATALWRRQEPGSTFPAPQASIRAGEKVSGPLRKGSRHLFSRCKNREIAVLVLIAIYALLFFGLAALIWAGTTFIQ